MGSQWTRVSGPRTEARFRSGDGDGEATIFRPAVSDDRGALPIVVDELITTKYRFEDINQGCQDMKKGKNIRGVVIYTDADR